MTEQSGNIERLTQSIARGKIARRTFLRRAAALGGMATFGGGIVGLLSACGGSSNVQQTAPTATTGAAAPTTAPATQAAATATTAAGSGSSGATPAASPVANAVYTGPDAAKRKIRELIELSPTQASDSFRYQAAQYAAAQLKQLGLTITVKPEPTTQWQDLVWYQREKWDMTAWDMVGRPERLDPDEFIVNLFSSSTAKDGYNFVGYNNPDYDKVAQAQRVEMDQNKRQQLVYQAQTIINHDQPYVFYVYPHATYAFNTSIWDPNSVVDAAGLGIKNFWTFVGATPVGSSKDMILNSQSDVSAINPLYISGGTDSWVTELIWDRLMRVDPTGMPKPYAAETVQFSSDGTSITCKLRQGMKWHDGQPVTADDVVFSFQAPAGTMSPMYKPFVAPVKEVKAVDTLTVQFTLNQPTAPFATSGLSKLNLIPKHVWDPILQKLQQQGTNAEKYQEAKPIGSGPFKFVNWQKTAEIDLEANTDHFSAPKMGRWVLRIVPNQSAALGSLTSGELNFLSDYSGDPTILKQTVDSSQNLKMVSSIVVGFDFLAPNHRRQPFGDVNFRRAMSTAIGINPMITNIYKGDTYATIADSMVSKALKFWHDPNLTDYPTSNIDAAKKILIDAGYQWDSDGNLLYPAGTTETLKPET